MSTIVRHGIQCPHCNDVILKEDIGESHDLFECSVCGEVYERKEESELCCKEERVEEKKVIREAADL